MAANRSVAYLNAVLAPTAKPRLPYPSNRLSSVRKQILELVQEFPSLTLQVGTYPYNYPGAPPLSLLKAQGTVPMYHQNVRYNLPLEIWIPQNYPQEPPLCIVMPTSNMIIKPNHTYVDATGKCNTPYLREWSGSESNLTDLVHTLCIICGQEPPLYSRGPGQGATHTPPPLRHPQPSPHHSQHAPHRNSANHHQQPSQQPPNARHSQQQQHIPVAVPVGSSGNAVNAYPTPPSSQQRVPFATPINSNHSNSNNSSQGATAATPASNEEPSAVFRRRAVAVLTEKLQTSLRAHNERSAVELDALYDKQGTLAERRQTVESVEHALNRERESLEEVLQMLQVKTSEMSDWLANNGAKVDDETSIDDIFEASDDFSKQVLKAMAEDQALEDVEYEVESLFKNEMLSLEEYLQHQRKLARQQFFARATLVEAQRKAGR